MLVCAEHRDDAERAGERDSGRCRGAHPVGGKDDEDAVATPATSIPPREEVR